MNTDSNVKVPSPFNGLAISQSSDRTAVPVPVDWFTGEVKLEMLFTPDGPDRASAGLVSFPPGARTHWHSHPLGQTLVVTAGLGRVQREGGPVQTIRVGDVVRIPPHVKHWHGAAPDSSMSHIAIQEALENKTADWMEPVNAVQYEGLAPSVTTEQVRQ